MTSRMPTLRLHFGLLIRQLIRQASCGSGALRAYILPTRRLTKGTSHAALDETAY
jgi:hypothetical protein